MKRFAVYGVTLTLNNYKSVMFSVVFLQYVNTLFVLVTLSWLPIIITYLLLACSGINVHTSYPCQYRHSAFLSCHLNASVFMFKIL